MVLEGPVTGEWFAAYAQQILAPTLQPGDIVAKSRRPNRPGIWNAIGEALPRYTPEECANYFTATGYEPE